MTATTTILCERCGKPAYPGVDNISVAMALHGRAPVCAACSGRDARHDIASVHETSARWQKVARMLADVVMSETDGMHCRVVRSCRPEVLCALSEHAGVKPPSDKTLALFRELLKGKQ